MMLVNQMTSFCPMNLMIAVSEEHPEQYQEKPQAQAQFAVPIDIHGSRISINKIIFEITWKIL